MSDKLLSILLIGIATVLLFIILGWGLIRRIPGMGSPEFRDIRYRYDRLRRIHISYSLVLIAFTIISGLYFFLPRSRYFFYEIKWLNNHYVNTTGCIILIIAFILVILNQVKLDKNLHLYYFNINQQSNSSLVPKTENNLLKSILLVYVAMFVIVSTMATATLLFASFIVYYQRRSDRNYKIKTALPTKQQLYS